MEGVHESPPPAPEASMGAHGRSNSAGLPEPSKPSGSKLQQFSSKFKLRRAKPAGAPGPGTEASHRSFKGISEDIVGQAMPSYSETAASASSVTASELGAGFSIRKGSAGIEEFNPKASHPSNPLAPIAPLLTKMMKPITVPSKALMARTFKGRPSIPGAAASPLPPAKFDGTPPMGYLWLWMGGFMRWRRRFFVASEAPGVLLIYKRMNMKGKVWSISMRNANIHEDEQDPRQLKILTPSGLIFLRACNSEERGKWLNCLSQSIKTFHEKQQLVEGLQEQGLLPPLTLKSKSASKRLATMHEGPGPASGGMPSTLESAGIKLLPTGEVADMDVEQRRRIRTRVGEKLSEITPFQLEVEHHMNQLSSQLLGVVSALNIRVGTLTPATSNVRLSHYLANTQAGVGGGGHSFSRTASSPTPTPSNPRDRDMLESLVEKAEDESASPVAAAAAAAAAAAVAAGPGSSAAVGAGSGAGAGAGTASSTAPTTAAPDPAAEEIRPAGLFTPSGSFNARPVPHAAAFRSSALRFPTSRPTNLQQAYAQMLEAFRCILHGESVRIAQLEAENQALHRTLQVTKVSEARRLKASRSNAGTAGGGLSRLSPEGLGRSARAYDERHAAPLSLGLGLQRVASDLSVMTADEDAFDVLEAFDDSVDYAILEEPGYGSLQEGEGAGAGAHAAGHRGRMAQALHEAGATTEDQDEDEGCLSPRVQDGDDEESDEDDDADAEEFRQEAEVLQALEVVRQVQYVEQAHSAGRLAAVIATQAPPRGPDEAQLSLQATADESESDEDDEDETPEEDKALVEAGQGQVDPPLVRVSVPHSRRRTRLPAAKPLGRGFSVWSVLKDMIGKDLTRITMPATINEPLTFLQRLAESFEYSKLLEAVSTTQDSTTRMMIVAVWQMSCYNSQPLREGKPFNPLLGETYEWQAPDGSVRYLCEQVSHHPPVSAYHVQGGLNSAAPWEVQGEFELKTKFWGKSIELLMIGCEALKVPSFNEEYRWNKATICVNDLIFGNFYADIYGKIKICNRNTGDVAVLNLHPCKGRKERRGNFDGTVFDGKGREVYKLSGSTMDKVFAALTPAAAASKGGNTEPVLMWQKDPYPDNFEVQYNFTKFAIAMNDPGDPIVPHLAPTDARFRPDQRALEVGEFARATSEKLRLEEKQRQARRTLADAGLQYQPKWFVQQGASADSAPHGRKGVPLTKTMDQDGFVWAFTGDYWRKREVKDWSGCLDLYS